MSRPRYHSVDSVRGENLIARLVGERWRECEHCDGERSDQVREDRLRGYVCPPCDSALDEMLGEGSYAKRATQ